MSNLTHDEYIKRRSTVIRYMYGESPDIDPAKAIDELVLWVKDNVNQVGDDADKFEAIVKGGE